MRKFFLATLMAFGILCGFTSVQAAVERPISYLQYDARWGSENYGSRSQTIANSGCGPTSMAMVLNYYFDNNITPVETTKFALSNGFRTSNQGTAWGYFTKVAQEYGLEYIQTSSKEEARNWMETKNDPLIICSMTSGLWTRGGHFILLWNYADGIAYINDPASEQANRLENSFDYMASQCKQYFCYNKPIPEVVEEPVQEEIDILFAFQENNIPRWPMTSPVDINRLSLVTLPEKPKHSLIIYKTQNLNNPIG